MWQGEILAGIAGLCGGAVVAVALAAFIIELGIIPRFAGITHTANHIFLYENCLMLGSFLGNLIYIYLQRRRKAVFPCGVPDDVARAAFFSVRNVHSSTTSPQPISSGKRA